MDSWQRLNETLFPDEKQLNNNLTMGDITGGEYKHVRRIWQDLRMQELGGYLDLNVESDTLLLVDEFENVPNKCVKIYKLDSAYFLSAPGQQYG